MKFDRPANFGHSERLMRRKDEWRQCSSKIRYRNEAEAHDMARKARDRRGAVLRAYFCDACEGYRLTKRL